MGIKSEIGHNGGIDQTSATGVIREINLLPGETLHVVTPSVVFERKDVEPGVFSQLEDLLIDDHIWESLKNQSSNDPDQQFDNYSGEYNRAIPVATALRDSGASVLQVFDVVLNCARSSSRRSSDEFIRFKEAKAVTIEFKKFADRHLFETVELKPGQLEELIDRHYNSLTGDRARTIQNHVE